MPVRMQRAGHELDYQRGVRSAVRGLWSGELNWRAAVDTMVIAIERNFTRAWEDGLASCGLTLGDMTLEEQTRLSFEINSEITHVYNFIQAVQAQSRANGGRLRDLYDRADMWTNRYESIRDLARTYACSDQKLMWRMNVLKEHCPSCLRLDGRVYRASVWRKADIYPRMHRLDCKGFRCGCEFITTSEPVTPGPPPMI